VTDAQIIKLIGTTKTTINAVRDREHWNSGNIKPVDPVSLGLCSQIELDDVIAKAGAKRAHLVKKPEIQDDGPGLRSVADTLGQDEEQDARDVRGSAPTAASVFRNFKD
jgi:hypothetical protein